MGGAHPNFSATEFIRESGVKVMVDWREVTLYPYIWFYLIIHIIYISLYFLQLLYMYIGTSHMIYTYIHNIYVYVCM